MAYWRRGALCQSLKRPLGERVKLILLAAYSIDLLRPVFTGRRPAPPVQVLYFPSVYPRELVDAALGRQSGVNVALRVDPDTVDMAAFQPGEHISLPVADADIGGLARVLLLGNVEIAVLAARNVVGAAHAGPLAEVVALGCKDLDALVRAVGDIE